MYQVTDRAEKCGYLMKISNDENLIKREIKTMMLLGKPIIDKGQIMCKKSSIAERLTYIILPKHENTLPMLLKK